MPMSVTTCRLQLGPSFDFHAAAAVVPYLARLGITTVYTSPYFLAGSRSTSGYDVCDPNIISPELGGDDGFRAFASALKRASLGHMVDVVANHMGTDASRNRWWRDLLAHGHASPFAAYFDIDWNPAKLELRERILLPILARPYGEALEAGDIQLRRDGDQWVIAAGGQNLPLRLGPDDTPDRLETPDALHRLLERQVYRLAYWRTASDEINYRRFFDVDGLAGIRMEEQDVFDAVHTLLTRLVEDGIVTSVRVDHPDGLARPGEYFARLRARLDPVAGRRVHVVAEKILTGDEALPGNWDVDGTTGYDFLNLVCGLFIRPEGAATLARRYRRIGAGRDSFPVETRASKRHIMSSTMASEVAMLAGRLNRISEQHWRSRDFTLNNLRRAIVGLVSELRVYRTYLGDGPARAQDVAEIRTASAAARRDHRALEPSVFRFLEAVLLGEAAPGEYDDFPPSSAREVEDRRQFTARFQQFAASVFAKGVEDTAFYRYQPLLALNEVGGDPSSTGRSVREFHRVNGERALARSRTMLATSTHDTKLGEDVRARLSALSEMPDEWRRVLREWRRIARQGTRRSRDSQIDENDAYRFFQALAGTWPCDGDAAASPAYADRLVEFMRKSVREAKRNSSWINPDPGYETALEDLVRRTIARLLQAGQGAPPPFVHRLARVGAVNSLAQLTLKLTSPGIADMYQGTELWDLNLVDPDNRRPVDFDRRAAMLDELEPLIHRVKSGDSDAESSVRSLLDVWPDGRIKFVVTASALRLRREWSDVFLDGTYEPLSADSGEDPGVLAFHRANGGRHVVVAVPRFVAAWTDGRWPTGEEVWGKRRIFLPGGTGKTCWRHAFTGALTSPQLDGGEAAIALADLFRALPVAILCADVRR
jgi:(1->4)-alpha-D-glucan 1-alpha-D-glucosylmutase